MDSPLPQSIGLHLGAHKTASSHLQNVLYRNREMLAQEGIRVYGPGYLRRPGQGLAAMFDLSWSDSPRPRRNAQDQLRFLARRYKRLVFTEENFVGLVADKLGAVSFPVYPLAASRLGELLAAWAPFKPQVFVAVRNPASFMASAYSQSLIGGTFVGPRTFRARNDWRQVDWADYIARLRAVPGVGDLYVWRQEDYHQTQRLILRRMLRWRVGPKIETVEGRVNEGLSAAAVRQTLLWQQDGEVDDPARKARHMFPINQNNPRFNLYAPSTLASSEAVYAAQMAQIEAMEGVNVLHPPAAAVKG